MTADQDTYKAAVKRWTLFLGVLQITVACIVGFIPPAAVAWFRGIVMAHIEFAINGILLIAFGFLVTEMKLGPKMLTLWFLLLQIGTWANGVAGVAGAFIGASSGLMPTINEKFPPPNGSENPIVTNILLVCGVTILAAMLITLYGLARSKCGASESNA